MALCAPRECLLSEVVRAWLAVEWGAYSDPVQFVSVIGRGGEQISRIQAESGCKIQIASGKGFFFFTDLSLVEIGLLQSLQIQYFACC